MERIDRHFEGVAWKYLSAVDAESKVSNQHELGGLVKAGFDQQLGGYPTEHRRFSARFILLDEEEDVSLGVEGAVTWYDSRQGQKGRSPELRLYYTANIVTERLAEGMFLVAAKARDGSVVLAFAQAGSSAESQLRWLFGLEGGQGEFFGKQFEKPETRESWAARWILEELGIKTDDDTEVDCNIVIGKFPDAFPTTKNFSAFARSTVNDIDPRSEPDNALMAYVGAEERWFRCLEKHFVESRLNSGFAEVDEFVTYALSVLNRRKSRAGQSLEHHLAHIFTESGIPHTRQAVTEGKTTADFLFPGQREYHDPTFPDETLTMLGAKTSCKDRWRQILSEASRIENKHLATLEPAISKHQTDEMNAQKVQLVVPQSLHATYSTAQRDWIWSVRDFIEHVRDTQQ